jgi:hypothetical protein
MNDFEKEKKYIFDGSAYIIERKIGSKVEGMELGKFIQYINIHYHGDFYEKGKAEFENGFVTFPYFDRIKEM